MNNIIYRILKPSICYESNAVIVVSDTPIIIEVCSSVECVGALATLARELMQNGSFSVFNYSR